MITTEVIRHSVSLVCSISLARAPNIIVDIDLFFKITLNANKRNIIKQKDTLSEGFIQKYNVT